LPPWSLTLSCLKSARNSLNATPRTRISPSRF
jgi:hypothetical protein